MYMISEYSRRLAGDTRAATAIEYALIAGGIALAIISAVNAIGIGLVPNFTDVNAGF